MSNENIWVLLYSDAPNPAGIPPQRPARISRTEMAAPWMAMDMAAYQALLASTQSAYDAWRAANPKPSPEADTLIVSPDGQVWKLTISNAGTIKGVKT